MKYLLWNESVIYFRLPNNKLRIGIDESNSWNIEDEKHIWEKLFSLCDGSKTKDEIFNYMNKYESFDEVAANEGIKLLYKKRVIFQLEASITKNSMYEKFKNNILYFSDFCENGFALQEELLNLKVTIFGLGGGGFSIFEQLLSLGVRNFTLVNFDKIEEKNLNRQGLWKIEDIGKYKIDYAEEYGLKKNPKLIVEKKYLKVDTVEKAVECMINSDWVFSCMDEPPYKLQRIVNKAAFTSKIPVAYSFCQKNTGRYFFTNHINSPCVDCLFSEIMSKENYEFMSSLYNSNFKPATATVIFSLSLICSAVIKTWLEILSDKIKNSEYFSTIYKFDFKNLKAYESIKWSYNNSCPTCGSEKIKSADLIAFMELIKIA